MKTVKELRQSGYKVRVHHFRKFNDLFALDFHNPKGGSTEIEVTSPEGIYVKAEAKCSDQDNFCRKTGVAIALGRALKLLEEERVNQPSLWVLKAREALQQQFAILDFDGRYPLSYGKKEDQEDPYEWLEF